MNDRMFDSPVYVRCGNSLVKEISSIEDALEFLYEWPKDRRGTIFETALRACKRAFDNLYPVPAARQAFCGFAKSARILEDALGVLPWTVPASRDRGGLAA
jgi:hypothetical protein